MCWVDASSVGNELPNQEGVGMARKIGLDWALKLLAERNQLQSESEKQRKDYSNKLNELNQMVSLAQQELNQEKNTIKKIQYCIENSIEISENPILKSDYGDLEVNFFGDHNLENFAGARWICQLMGVESIDFYETISSFTGASRRLEIVYRGFNNILLKDFAHSPSKVRASCKSVDSAFPNFKKIYLIGFSLGALIARHFAFEHGDRLSALIIHLSLIHI